MDSKRAAVRQTRAAEAQAESVKDINKRLDALEAKIDEILTTLNRSQQEKSTDGRGESKKEKAPAKASR